MTQVKSLNNERVVAMSDIEANKQDSKSSNGVPSALVSSDKIQIAVITPTQSHHDSEQ